ncbi:MAG: hypothetical protein RL885_24980 [Planctomycetota bacterium]
MKLDYYTSRTLSMIVHKDGEAIFSDGATRVEIDDEGAGEFVRVRQDRDDGSQSVTIDVAEWPVLRETVGRMIEACASR